MFTRKRKVKSSEKYIIAFCDEPSLSTKFGQHDEIFPSHEAARHRIFSKVNGWGKAIQSHDGNITKIDSAYLIIEKI